MPFQKGRKKTGGRVKGGPKPKPTRLIDQLKAHGFDYIKEFANALKALPDESLKRPSTRYIELRDLLPFMAPKLKEKEVLAVEQPQEMFPKQELTAEDLEKAINGTEAGQLEPEKSPEPVHTPSVGEGSPELQIQASTEENLPDVDTQQENN